MPCPAASLCQPSLPSPAPNPLLPWTPPLLHCCAMPTANPWPLLRTTHVEGHERQDRGQVQGATDGGDDATEQVEVGVGHSGQGADDDLRWVGEPGEHQAHHQGAVVEGEAAGRQSGAGGEQQCGSWMRRSVHTYCCMMHTAHARRCGRPTGLNPSRAPVAPRKHVIGSKGKMQKLTDPGLRGWAQVHPQVQQASGEHCLAHRVPWDDGSKGCASQRRCCGLAHVHAGGGGAPAISDAAGLCHLSLRSPHRSRPDEEPALLLRFFFIEDQTDANLVPWNVMGLRCRLCLKSSRPPSTFWTAPEMAARGFICWAAIVLCCSALPGQGCGAGA